MEKILTTKGDTITNAEGKAARAPEQAAVGQQRIAKNPMATTQTITTKDTATKAVRVMHSVSGGGGEIRSHGKWLPLLRLGFMMHASLRKVTRNLLVVCTNHPPHLHCCVSE